MKSPLGEVVRMTGNNSEMPAKGRTIIFWLDGCAHKGSLVDCFPIGERFMCEITDDLFKPNMVKAWAYLAENLEDE